MIRAKSGRCPCPFRYPGFCDISLQSRHPPSTPFRYIVQHASHHIPFDMKNWKQTLMKHKRIWWSLLAIAGVAAVVNYTWLQASQDTEQQARKTTRLALDSLTETVIATGVIRPVVGAEVNVGSRISGTVVSLPVEVGDKVEVNQL